MASLSENKIVIVTGATGFIGQHLIPILIKRGLKVIAVARDRKKAERFSWLKKVKFLSFDIAEELKQLKINQGMSLIHLAWDGLSDYKSSIHIEYNLPNSFNFIKSLINRGVSQVLVTGTCFEYGFQNGPIPSSAKTSPNNPYATAKDTLRKQLESLNKEKFFCLQWSRLFYMYGKGQSPNSLLSQLDIAIKNGESKFNMSGGEQLRDYLPIEEIVKQLFNLYESGRCGTYNICSGYPISVRRLVEQRVKESGSNIKLNLGYYPYPDYEPMEFWGIRDFVEKK